MKNSKITICDATVQPGEVANFALPLPEQYSCAPLYMPIKVLHGKTKGPCLLVFSTLKGSELNGIEIVNRLVKSINIEELKGTVIAIPVLNVYGLTHFPSMLPSGSNLVNCFPGKEEGSFGERLAHLFTQEILKKADCCIELLTGDLNHNIIPQVYCNFDNPKAKKLAKAFQTPVVTNVSIDSNPFRQTTEHLQVPLLAYEGGEAMRFDENAITVGLQGITNVMVETGMLPEVPLPEFKPIFSQDEEWIKADKGGILHACVGLGDVIKKGEMVGQIVDPFGTDFSQKVESPMEGVVVGINTTPLLYEGLPIFKIASFLDCDKAEDTIEQWEKEQAESL